MVLNRPPISVFISYSSRDEGFREELKTHLSLLRREGVIDDWYFRKIRPGDEWEKVISEQLEDASLILLLVSADFLASDYCYEIEMRRALDKHDVGTARVIPIIVRPVDWRSAPFSKLQALPADAQPVAEWQSRDRAWLSVASAIRELSRDLQVGDGPSKAKTSATAADSSTTAVNVDDLSKAESVVREGAEAGDADAAGALAAMLHAKGNDEEAESWYRRAAAGDDLDAVSNLGWFLQNTGRRAEAADVLRDGAEAGHSMSMFNLAVVLAESGSTKEAKLWYQKAAEKGNALASNNLGQLYEQEGDLAAAERWFERSANDGNPKAAFNFGLQLQRSGDVELARTWYRRAAEQGNVNGAHSLAVLLEESGATAEAETWYRQAVERGHLGAANNLGLLLIERGNREEGLELLRRAASAGQLQAATNLLGYRQPNSH